MADVMKVSRRAISLLKYRAQRDCLVFHSMPIIHVCIRVSCECVYECTQFTPHIDAYETERKGRKKVFNGSNRKDTVAIAKISRLIYNNLQTSFFLSVDYDAVQNKERKEVLREKPNGKLATTKPCSYAYAL